MLPANFPSDSNQKKILKAFKKVGWELLDESHGKGSHRKVRDPKSGFIYIVQNKIYKEVIKSCCKVVDEKRYDVEQFIRYL